MPAARPLPPRAGRWRTLERWLLRLPVPEPGTIHLNRRRIYVLPTGVGFGLGLTLMVMLLASINYNLSLGYGLTFLVGAVATASMFHAYRNLLDLRIRPGRADPVFAGETACYTLLVENERARARPSLRFATDGGASDPAIEGAGCFEVRLERPTHVRGWLPIGRVHLETRWPLGFIRAWSVLHPDLACLIYPRPEEQAPPLPPPSGGNQGRRLQGSGEDDFAGLRLHREADSPRHVAWKVVARGGPMLTKTFDGARGGELLLAWQDLPANLDAEQRLSRLTAWVCRAEAANLRYGLRLPGRTLSASQGPAHLRACLSALALHGSAP